MQEVLPQLNTVAGICKRQVGVSGPFRMSRYCFRTSVEQGELLYNNMTGELILLSSGEAAELLSNGQLRDELVSRWFLVPEGYDEHAFAQQIWRAVRLFTRQKTAITNFVVFPTTDCNARCFYCYELGRPRKIMSDEVAHDAAAFIVRCANGRDVRINWFGGEPLYNRHAIDVITSDLSELGVDLTSQMTTNGYLFDKELVRHAREDWNLDSVQIALDGTENVYNRSKAYVDIKGSAYQRVMRNIELLADDGVKVSLRLNLNGDNEQVLLQLADELAKRFGNRRNVSAYTVLLRDFGFGTRLHESEEKALVAYESLQRHLVDLGIGWRWYPRNTVSVNQCMADNDGWLTILPDGRVGKCEHESEDKLVGSIYEDRLDNLALQAWKQTIESHDCQGCLFYPSCIRLKQCAWNVGGCTEHDRKLMRSNLAQRIHNALERYLSKQDMMNEDDWMSTPGGF